MSDRADAHDPSVRFADTSPAALGRNEQGDYGLCRRTGSRVTVRRPRL